MFSGSTHDIGGIAWLLALGILLCLVVAREFGYWLRRRKSRSDAREVEDGFTLTSVLGLLALLVGFTFSISLSRYDTRRELVIAEANAIGTTALRVQLLDANVHSELDPLLRAYVAERIVYGSAAKAQGEDASYARASILQNRFWQAMSRGIIGGFDRIGHQRHVRSGRIAQGGTRRAYPDAGPGGVAHLHPVRCLPCWL
jgi:hypothetical protein